jgi:hypothetical protein
MSTTPQTSQTLTGLIGLWHRISTVVNDPDFAAVVLFSALGLLASFYFITHFALPVEDATLLTAWM